MRELPLRGRILHRGERSAKVSLYLLFISRPQDTQSSCVFIRGECKGPVVNDLSKNISTVVLSLWTFAVIPTGS